MKKGPRSQDSRVGSIAWSTKSNNLLNLQIKLFQADWNSFLCLSTSREKDPTSVQIISSTIKFALTLRKVFFKKKTNILFGICCPVTSVPYYPAISETTKKYLYLLCNIPEVFEVLVYGA